MRRLNEQKRIHNFDPRDACAQRVYFVRPSFESEKYTMTRCEMGDAGKFGDAVDFFSVSTEYSV